MQIADLDSKECMRPALPLPRSRTIQPDKSPGALNHDEMAVRGSHLRDGCATVAAYAMRPAELGFSHPARLAADGGRRAGWGSRQTG